MFQRAMLLAVVVFFCQSVIHPMKWHLLLRATAYMKSNLYYLDLLPRTWKKEKKTGVPVFVFI